MKRVRKTTFLYVLRNGDELSKLYKIGIASNVDARVAQLQTGNPYTIELAHIVEFPDRSLASAIELRMHETLREHRRGGEWFEIGLDHILAALEKVAAHFKSQLGIETDEQLQAFIQIERIGGNE